MSIVVLGGGAFGTSLAIALSRDGQDVTLWMRDAHAARDMQTTRTSGPRLAGYTLPQTLAVTPDLPDLANRTCLIAVPTQHLAAFLRILPDDAGALVACCKGIDRATGLGPVATIEAEKPGTQAAMLTGPSFAFDIAAGLPTALVLATRDDATGQRLQDELTRPTLRLYRSTDVIGAELGGALKNVIALAAGMAIGAGLGDSARASVIARGFGEMIRYATARSARQETLNGLSGLGDLVLTCTSEKSRNFTAGIALGKGAAPTANTVEGLATAEAVAAEARRMNLDLPLLATVAAVVSGQLDIQRAIATLLARPVGKE
ncbi:MAG: NAD(P)-dependent glycerol-3-phosphate dehydrogenase [Silicimonas sp.]|nr:NAD(P)-dependent glycerol-3-phosphate dehydrogenase [Silicimonas sp.]